MQHNICAIRNWALCITTAHCALIWTLLERNDSCTLINEQQTHVFTTIDMHKLMNKKTYIYRSFVHYGTIWTNLNSLLCCQKKHRSLCIHMCTPCTHHTHSLRTLVLRVTMSNLNRALTNTMFLRLLLHYHYSTAIYWISTLLMNQLCWVLRTPASLRTCSHFVCAWFLGEYVHTCMCMTITEKYRNFTVTTVTREWMNECLHRIITQVQLIDVGTGFN